MVLGHLFTPHLDAILIPLGFSRRSKLPRYHRRLGTARQKIEIIFHLHRSADLFATAQPWVEVTLPSIASAISMLVGSTPFPPTGKLRQPAALAAPDDEPAYWELTSESDAARVARQVGAYLAKWTVPFLDEYYRETDVIRSVESRERFTLRDRNQIMSAVAAALLELGPTAASNILDEHAQVLTAADGYAEASEYLRRKRLN